MDDVLKTYILDSENPIENFKLARSYHDVLDYSSAVSFYLRAKERTNDIEMQNKCIGYIIECSKKLQKTYLVPELEKYITRKNKKIVDCFTFFNETEILELRLNLLNDYVDEFVITESNYTFSGRKKEYICKKFVKELGFEDKVTVYEMNLDEYYLTPSEMDLAESKVANSSEQVLSWTRERMQRDYIMAFIHQYNDDTAFILSDCDEIINPDFVEYFVKAIHKYGGKNYIKVPLVLLEGRADQRLFNGDKPADWSRSLIICTASQLKNGGAPSIFRGQYKTPISPVWITENGEILNDCGWHFSWMGKEKRKEKALSFAHHANLNVVDTLSVDSFKEFVDDKLLIEQYKNKCNYTLKEYNWSLLPREIFKSKRVFDYLLPPK